MIKPHNKNNFNQALLYSNVASVITSTLCVFIYILTEAADLSFIELFFGGLLSSVVWSLFVALFTYPIMLTFGTFTFFILKTTGLLSFVNFVSIGVLTGYYFAKNLTNSQLTDFDFYLPFLCAFYGFVCSAAFYYGYKEKKQ